MKMSYIKLVSLSAILLFAFAQCSKDRPPKKDFEGTYVQEDQMGRPAVNRILVPASSQNAFNTTIPSQMHGAFFSDMLTTLYSLNPNFSTNFIGQNDTMMVSLFATDVLTLSTTGVTTFYDGSNIITGRKLSDDVMNFELTLIYGGPTGVNNPGLTDDKVNVNDKAFSNSFPYLATPH